MNKYAISQILREIGILIELQDKNPLKGLAYRRAANSLETVSDLEKWIQKGNLEKLPGIGSKIAKLIVLLHRNGHLSYYENLRKKVPESIYELLNIPGISVQKVRVLWQEFDLKNLEELSLFLTQENRKIPGFSPSFLRKMQKRIALIQKQGFSLLWRDANAISLQLQCAFEEMIEITGEVRRKCDVVYALDFVVSVTKPFSHPLILRPIKQTKNSLKVLLKKGIYATFHQANERNAGFYILKTTGSKRHIARLKKLGLNKKCSGSESAIYKNLNLPFIPPELREDGSEIDAAKKGKLPKLVELEDLKGAFHCHTTASDGADTLSDMVKQAKKIGWSYLGISEHSQSLKIARGISEERLYQQIQEIRKINKKHVGEFTVFAGVECDILKDGSLDYDDALLKELDYVIVSIHSHFKMAKKEMTKRIIKAIEHPLTTMVGHLTGRLLRYRDGYALNIPKIIDACAANHTIIELNAYPNRLDMPWQYWRHAKEKNVKCSINPDAHSKDELFNCQYGINSARKGWLEKEDVVNTLPLKGIKRFLRH